MLVGTKHDRKPGALRFLNSRGQTLIMALLFGVIATILLRWFPLKVGIVLGDSMTPSFKPNQPFVIDRSYYTRHEPARGDVIVFKMRDEIYIKRIVGVPGDRIWLVEYSPQTESSPYKEVVPEQNLGELRKYLHRHPKVGRIRVFTVPEGTLYVVGDAENISVDSRQFGPISRDRVIGKVLAPQVKAPPDPGWEHLSRPVKS
jgi:signal peptidase I